MGSARTVLVSDMTTRFNYELRNVYAKQWVAAETLEYVNKWMEFIHHIMAEYESDFVQTGTGQITTVAGTDQYSLSSNSIGDLLAIPGGECAEDSRVRISASKTLTLGKVEDRTYHLIQKDIGTQAYSEPNEYYIHGGYFGVLPIPDAAYVIKIDGYIPDYTALTTSSTMPYQNLFNNVLVEGVKIFAKNREGYGTAVDAALMELFQDRVMSILRKRQKQDVRFTP